MKFHIGDTIRYKFSGYTGRGMITSIEDEDDRYLVKRPGVHPVYVYEDEVIRKSKTNIGKRVLWLPRKPPKMPKRFGTR